MENKSKYSSFTEWAKAKPNDFNSAKRQGFLDDICELYGWKNNEHYFKKFEDDKKYFKEMIKEGFFEGYNINDCYETRKEVLNLIEEFGNLENSIKSFLGPKKVKSAAVDARRILRNMSSTIKDLSEKIQKTKESY